MRDGANRRRPWVPPEEAGPDGLVGVGGDLRPATLLRAYADGVFPWFNDGDPVLWWCPDPRLVLPTEGFVIRRSLRKRLGLTQAELARLAGVSTQAVVNWEATQGAIPLRRKETRAKLQGIRSLNKRSAKEILGKAKR